MALLDLLTVHILDESVNAGNDQLRTRLTSIAELQTQVDRFVATTTMFARIAPQDGRRPVSRLSHAPRRRRARSLTSTPTSCVSVTTRSTSTARSRSAYRSKLHHFGMGRALNGTRVILLVAGRQIRVLDEQAIYCGSWCWIRVATTSLEDSGECPLCPATSVHEPRDMT